MAGGNAGESERANETTIVSMVPEREIMNIEQKVEIAVGRVKSAIRAQKPIAVFGLFSGGHDSLTALLVAKATGQMTAAVHINTGIGVEATRTFVRQTCNALKCPLVEKCAAQNLNAKGEPDPQIYEDIVKRFGFPGPGWHGRMYQRLKERPLRMVEREFGADCRGKRKHRVLYVNGCRSDESVRRMANTEELQVRGRVVWCAPIHDWTKLDCSLAIETFKAERNPVVDLIHKSGECLCGAFANSDRPNELQELSFWDLTRPAYNEIMRLEAIVRPVKGWGWGERPPKPDKRQYCEPGMLCSGCQKT